MSVSGLEQRLAFGRGRQGETTHDHGVEARTGEATIGAVKVGSSFKEAFEVGLGLGPPISEDVAIVEALISSLNRREGGRECGQA